ncbi:MAG: acyl carrier protein [Candidatus Daviesbacteria bacterium]|nr:acyl carrier protein [Candidatus Daviesbacteria bacterium]
MSDEKQIIQAIAEHLGLSPEDLDRQSLLQEDLGLGPVELNDLLNGLATKFDVIFTPEETENLEKVEDLIVLVEDNLLE